jgi:hypothetical protein
VPGGLGPSGARAGWSVGVSCICVSVLVSVRCLGGPRPGTPVGGPQIQGLWGRWGERSLRAVHVHGAGGSVLRGWGRGHSPELSVSMGVPGSVRGDGALLAGRLTVSR